MVARSRSPRRPAQRRGLGGLAAIDADLLGSVHRQRPAGCAGHQRDAPARVDDQPAAESIFAAPSRGARRRARIIPAPASKRHEEDSEQRPPCAAATSDRQPNTAAPPGDASQGHAQAW